jgi:phosphoglycerate dehydrogenase-like enzyme
MTGPDGARRPLRVLWRAAPPDPRPTAGDLPPGCELVVERDEERALQHRDAIDVLIDGRPGPLLDGACLARVIVPWAGFPPGLREALLERPHLKAHNAHYNAAFVAQHALALLLATAHRLVPIDAALRRGDWGDRQRPERSRHLAGGEALLLGYGAIGRHLAPMLRGLGMRVTALRRRPGDEEDGVRLIGPAGLPEALARADAVLVSLPGTPATAGLLDREALARLGPGALVVNVGRGNVIDEDALYDALANGRLAGAGLDVWWRYPEGAEDQGATPPATRPFWELPNVVLSPHRADATDASERARVADVCATLWAIAEGRERSRVDVEAGY